MMIAALLLAAAQPSAPHEMPRELAALVEPCALAAREAYRLNDQAIIFRHIRKLRERPERNRAAIIACAAYLQGVRESALYPRVER